MAVTPKIIVLDDDPTGSQTVHSCLLLTTWDVDSLCLGLTDAAPLFFVLTNTRSLAPEQAEKTLREVCLNLRRAIATLNITDYLVVSRSDSTLRGHYPLETDVIAAELGPFDAHFLVPAFLEGGRITLDSVHYLIIEGVPTPVDQTEFAQDSVFGYHHSYLPDYVAEKTKGQISADQVQRFLRTDQPTQRLTRLMQLEHNQCAVVDAQTQSDLDAFAADILHAAQQGKRFLFRSAASLLTALAQLPPQPVAPEDMGQYARNHQPGVFIVGSHVQKTTEQLGHLLSAPGIVGIEVDVVQLLEPGAAARTMVASILARVAAAHGQGQTPVVYTSRQELAFADVPARLDFGLRVSALLMQVVEQLPTSLGYLVSKGGITSNDTLSQGLKLRSTRLLGQVLPGCSVVCTESDHPRWPDLPVVLFPGNVGDADALVTVYQRLQPTQGA